MRNYFLCQLLLASIASICFYSCGKKNSSRQPDEEIVSAANVNNQQGHLVQTKTFQSEVGQKWQDLQLRILKQPAGANPYGLNGVRNFAYCGIALYESVVPGMPAYQSLHGQLTDMPEMPTTEPGKAYHWPTCANAALAFMNKHFYTATNAPAYQPAMDSLENALNDEYQLQADAATFARSKEFGIAVAEKVFAWSTTDSANHASDPYTPNGPAGSWTNTAPNPPGIFAPYWGHNRLFVQGSTSGTASAPPPEYSETPGSAYYNMAKEVYDVSQTLTPEQIAAAEYYRDSPGYPSGAAYIPIFNQIMQNENPPLDFYALAHVKTGISIAESQINCFRLKYDLLQDRPVRYIKNVLGHSTWSTLISTPPFPDFPSGHSQTGGAFAAAMTSLFGGNYSFTVHTYDYLGMAPRTYSSFDEMAVDIGKARVYGGIHYTYSCVEGRKQGEKIAQNVLNILRFKKD